MLGKMFDSIVTDQVTEKKIIHSQAVPLSVSCADIIRSKRRTSLRYLTKSYLTNLLDFLEEDMYDR